MGVTDVFFELNLTGFLPGDFFSREAVFSLSDELSAGTD